MIFFHLKNCLLLYFSMPQSAAFSPQRASFLFHACVLFFYGAAAFSFLFLKHRRHFSQLSLAVFVRSSSCIWRCAQNFLCILYKTSDFPSAIFISAVPLMRGAEGNAAVPCRVCTRQGTAIYSSVSGSGCSKLLSMSACSSCRAWSSSEYGTKKSVRVPTSPV